MSTDAKTSFYQNNIPQSGSVPQPQPSQEGPTPGAPGTSSFYQSGSLYLALSDVEDLLATANALIAQVTGLQVSTQSSEQSALAAASKASAWAYQAGAFSKVAKGLVDRIWATYSQAAAFAMQCADYLKKTKSAAAYAESAVSGSVAKASAFARQAKQEASKIALSIASVAGMLAAVQSLVRKARAYADQASLNYNAAQGAAQLALTYYKKARTQATAAAASAASLTDDQIALKAQVFN